jgi:hypothetical protein
VTARFRFYVLPGGSLVTELFAGAPKQNPAFGTVGGVLKKPSGNYAARRSRSVPAYSRFPDTKDCEAPKPVSFDETRANRLIATALLARDCAAVVPFDRSGHHATVLPWADGDTAWADADGDI